MAFLAVCPDCQHSQICVLDSQIRPRVLCSHCRTVFEAGAPALEPLAKVASAPVVVSATSATRSAPETTQSATPALKSKPPTPPPVAWPDVLHVKTPAASDDDEEEVLPPRLLVVLRKWMNPLGAVGLGLCALALLVAAIGRLSFLVWLLAAAAVVVGLIAIRGARRERRPLVMPATTAILGAILLLFAVAFPAALGPGYEAARDSAPSGPDLVVLAHPQFVHDPEVLTSGGVDASKASIQQGRVRVDVTDAWIELPPKGVAGSAGDLFVRIRLQRSKTGQEMTAGAFSPPLMWDERARASMIDTAGSIYSQKQTPPGRARAGGASSAGAVTIDVSHELLVFDAPATATQGLKLELPASAWGGKGSLWFFIPGTMVRVGPAPGRSK